MVSIKNLKALNQEKLNSNLLNKTTPEENKTEVKRLDTDAAVDKTKNKLPLAEAEALTNSLAKALPSSADKALGAANLDEARVNSLLSED